MSAPSLFDRTASGAPQDAGPVERRPLAPAPPAERANEQAEARRSTAQKADRTGAHRSAAAEYEAAADDHLRAAAAHRAAGEPVLARIAERRATGDRLDADACRWRADQAAALGLARYRPPDERAAEFARAGDHAAARAVFAALPDR